MISEIGCCPEELGRWMELGGIENDDPTIEICAESPRLDSNLRPSLGPKFGREHRTCSQQLIHRKCQDLKINR